MGEECRQNGLGYNKIAEKAFSDVRNTKFVDLLGVLNYTDGLQHRNERVRCNADMVWLFLHAAFELQHLVAEDGGGGEVKVGGSSFHGFAEEFDTRGNGV